VDVFQEFGIKREPDKTATVFVVAAPLLGDLHQLFRRQFSRGNACFGCLLQDFPQLIRGELSRRPKPDFLLLRKAELRLALLVNSLIRLVHQLPRVLKIVRGQPEWPVRFHSKAYLSQPDHKIVGDPAVRVNDAISSLLQSFDGSPVKWRPIHIDFCVLCQIITHLMERKSCCESGIGAHRHADARSRD